MKADDKDLQKSIQSIFVKGGLLCIFLFGIMLLFSGCTKKEADEFNDADLEQYQEYFRKYVVSEPHVMSNQELEKDYNKNKAEEDEWRQEYLLLMTEFMAGGFATSRNQNYMNGDYPQEYFEYCIEDINDDGIPELLLSYKYNGTEQNFWDVYSYDSDGEASYIGTIMYYDRERKILFDGFDGCNLNAYKFKDHQIINTFSYYIDEDEYCDDTKEQDNTKYIYKSENGEEICLSEEEYKKQISIFFQKDDIKFKGKTLNLDSLALDLGIDCSQTDISKKISYRSYYGLFKYYATTNSDMKNYKYSLVELDNDDIPEMIAVNNDDIKIFYNKNGRMYCLSGKVDYANSYNQCLLFQNKNVLMMYNVKDGVIKEEYYAIGNNEIQKFFTIEQSPAITVFGNEYERNKSGEVLYHYFIDGNIATKSDRNAVKNILYNTFKLENGISLSNLEFKSFEEIRNAFKE